MSSPVAARPVHAGLLLLSMTMAAPVLTPGASAQRSASHGAIAPAVTSRAATAFGPAVEEPCEATVIRRELLRDSTGARLYVSPDVVLARDGELLLAGHATARFATDVDGRVVDVNPRAFVAALRAVDGRVRTFAVPTPLADAHLRDLRAVPLPNRRWGVLFFNQATHPERTPTATSDSLWYGVLGPGGWERVDALPVPPDVRLRLPVARPMQARGATITAAVPAERTNGESGVLLLELNGSTWRTRFLATTGIAYAGLAFDGGTGALRLLVVHADPEVAPGGRSSNELYLYNPERMGDSRTRLPVFPALPALPAHHPIMLSVGRGLSIAWLAADRRDSLPRRVPTHLMVRDGVAEPPTVLGDAAVHVISVPAGREQVHVLTSHSTHVDSVQVDIRTLPSLSRGVRLRHSTSVAEVFGAGRWNDSTVVVTLLDGTIMEATSIATEVFWIKAQCSSSPEGNRVP